MNKNMNSPTKLTEFAPLSPEESQPVVASLFSKFFGFGKSTSSIYNTTTTTAAIATTTTTTMTSTSSNNDKQQSSSGDSDSWKGLDGTEKEKFPKEDDATSSINFSLDASEGRSLPNVLKRISNIVALKSNNLKSYKDSQLRNYWMPDSVAKQCYECGERFTTFRRRHHCRVCGQIFCSKCCSDEIPGKIMGCTGDLRVCTYCCKVVLSYLESSDMRSVLSADLKALQEDLQVKYGNDSRYRPQQHTSNDLLLDEVRVYRKPSVGYMEEKYALGRSSSCYLAATQEPSVVLQNSAPLRIIYEELFRSSLAIQLQTHRVRLKSFYNCFMGNELVNWMLLQKKAATRVQAAAIGQALLEAGFIESAQSENLYFADGPTLFKPTKLSLMQSIDLSDENQAICDSQEPAWVKNIPQHDSTTADSESETKVSSSPPPPSPSIQTIGRLPSSSSSFYLDLNVEASTVTLKRPTLEDRANSHVEKNKGVARVGDDGGDGGGGSSNNSSIDGTTSAIEKKEINFKSHRCESGVSDELLSDTLQVHEFKERNSWHKVNNLRSTFGEMSAYNALTSAYKQHQDSLIRQLLNKEGLSESWREPILSLGHNIVDQVRPDLYHDADDMDIGQYVQIKKLPGGSKNDCEIVYGVMCSKNVAHRGMNTIIAHPKILLLECGLMYQRVEGKLLSIEPVMLQEKEYLGHTVARITALGPDVVLVHRSVSRLAQDRFRQCGITLVLNVKLSVLERVARCTGGTIVSTIDAHLTTHYKLGTCNMFYLRNFPNESASGGKTLMYFEGCANAHLGATILLRGGSLAELKKVKNVMSTIIFASYSWRLEKSFLMDEFAKPPSSHGDNSFLDGGACEQMLSKGEPEMSCHRNSLMGHESRGSSQPDNVTIYCEDTRNIFENSPPNCLPGVINSATKRLDPVGGNSTPEKDNIKEENHGDDDDPPEKRAVDAESFMSPETFKRVSTMLEQHSDPYDTLKLFKTKTASSKVDEDGRNDRSEDQTTIIFRDTLSKIMASSDEIKRTKLRERIASEEKRVYGESVSDQSDPLHQYLKEDRDEDELVHRANAADNEKADSRLDDCDGFGKPPLVASLESQSLSVADLPLLNKFKKALDDTILSFSPYLKFSIPYLETEAGRNCALRRFFPKEIFYSVQFLDKVEGVRMSMTTTLAPTTATSTSTSTAIAKVPLIIDKCLLNLRTKPKHPFVQAKFTSSIESKEIQSLVANFRACGSRLYPTHSVINEKFNAPTKTEVVYNNGLFEQQQQPLIQTWPDCLEPGNHQRLSVLFCSFSHSRNNAPAFCVNPSVVNMDLYGRNDIALGRFLERYCLTSEYKCPAQSCRAQIAQHARRFAHDGGCVHISLTELSTDPFGQADTNQILMWTKCIKCKTVSAVVPMSPDTWSLSFAKYLELRFHGGVYAKRGPESDSNLNLVCRHSLHHEHSQYFTKKNMLAIFKYTKISQWEISLPPPLIHINYDAKQHANVIEEIKILALKGDEVFTNIRDKLSNLQLELDGSISGGGGNNGTSAVVTSKQQLAKEQQYFKNKIEEIQLKLTSPTLENKKLEGTRSSEKQVQNLMFRIEDGIVISKRLISEAVTNWNGRIQDTAAKRKDDRPRRFTERSLTSGSCGIGGIGSSVSGLTGVIGNETDGYVTEDTASESQIEDLSPMSADYSAVDAISAVHKTDFQAPETTELSDNEIHADNNSNAANLEEIIVIQESPKYHQRSHSDVLPISSEDMPDRKKRKKTILSQLLPSTTIINPITNPLGSFEHHLLPLGCVVPMVVYESEPSSIIAYALDTHDYKHALAEILRTYKGPELNPSPLYRRKFPDNKENFAGGADTTQSGESKRPSVLSFLRGNSPSPASPMETAECKTVSPAEPNSVTNPTTSTVAESEEDKRSSVKQQTYIEVQFNDATTNFYCRIYFAAQFAALRENVLPSGEDGFTRSLCRSIQWAARGGKSGSTFCKSRDDRFILKELSRLELQIFLEFAPNYFAYMEKCQQTKQPTLLGKIVGVYRVSFKNNTTNAALRTSVLVMENLFYGRAITDKFDLKGSVRNRLVNPEEADSEGELVLLDENLLNMSCDSPLYIRSHSKAVLNKAIEQDTKFLADNSVMDYSLLVGLEPNSDELVLGIIDYIRTFTWDKKLETIVKKSGILGGQGKLPTIVSPEEYRARFIAAMHRYFLPVPDRWTGLARGVEST